TPSTGQPVGPPCPHPPSAAPTGSPLQPPNLRAPPPIAFPPSDRRAPAPSAPLPRPLAAPHAPTPPPAPPAAPPPTQPPVRRRRLERLGAPPLLASHQVDRAAVDEGQQPVPRRSALGDEPRRRAPRREERLLDGVLRERFVSQYAQGKSPGDAAEAVVELGER